MQTKATRYEDALIAPPLGQRRTGKTLPLAVLDRHGNPIEAAACATHRYGSALFRHEPDLLFNPERLAGSWLFGGLASHHFGHQITRSLGRLADLEALPGLDGVVFAPLHRGAKSAASRALFARLLKGMGLRVAVRFADAPTRVEKLWVGRDRFSEQTGCRATPEYVAWARSQMLPPGARPRPGSRIYVTRSRLDPRLGRILCEDLLERNLIGHGYEVFVPEAHALSDQIRRYAEAETIVTTDGSHGHLIAFARQSGQRIVMIARRSRRPDLLLNHLESFGQGLDGSSFMHLDVLREEWWRPVRADNMSLGELDFEALRRKLLACGAIGGPDGQPWTVPDPLALQRSKDRGLMRGESLLPSRDRSKFMAEFRRRRREKTVAETEPGAAAPMPAIEGLRYLRMLRRLHALLKPAWYLEIGTHTGRSLSLARCNYVAVDPDFRIEHPVVNGTGRQMHLFQTTSDAFFASGFPQRNGLRFDLAFLDGLHLFEFLLRDFMNTERIMAPGGTVVLHDCCPTNVTMASRERPPGLWTGDVWKALLILLEHRPDLDIRVAAAAPTGLVIVGNLDPQSPVLDRVHEEAVARYADLSLEDLDGGPAGLYRRFDLLQPEAVLAGIAARRPA